MLLRQNSSIAALLLLVACLGRSGVATAAEEDGSGPPPAAAVRAGYLEEDPWMGFNRAIFTFNDKLDVYLLEPVGKAWDFVVPDRAQRCVSNFFDNLAAPRVLVNDILQGKMHYAAADVARFMTNTTFGVVGLFDVASEWGLPQSDEDFGQTLAVWGVPAGPDLVLPFFGPSSPRDTVGLGADSAAAISFWFVDLEYTIGARAVEITNTRARLLDTVRQIKEGSFDYYAAVRNGYLQHRTAQIEDRHATSEGPSDDLYKLEE
jgi:phospholipid-binding lipoprotein MlaA